VAEPTAAERLQGEVKAACQTLVAVAAKYREAAKAAEDTLAAIASTVVAVEIDEPADPAAEAAASLRTLRLLVADGTTHLHPLHPDAIVPGLVYTGIAGVPTEVAAAFPHVFFRAPAEDSDGDFRLGLAYFFTGSDSVRYTSVDAAQPLPAMIEAIREIVG
jgi:hypothetical protein